MCQKNYNRNLLTQNLTLTQGKFVGCEGAGSILKGAILGGEFFGYGFKGWLYPLSNLISIFSPYHIV